MTIYFLGDELYNQEQFYTKYSITDLHYGELPGKAIGGIEYNKELLAEYYGETSDWEVRMKFFETLYDTLFYYIPRVFNETIALECRLVPFSYLGCNMLANDGCYFDLSPKLEAYQALVDKI